MLIHRRRMLSGIVAAPAILTFGSQAARAAATLKISHQFPGGTIDKGDFRDRLCRVFAQKVEARMISGLCNLGVENGQFRLGTAPADEAGYSEQQWRAVPECAGGGTEQQPAQPR